MKLATTVSLLCLCCEEKSMINLSMRMTFFISMMFCQWMGIGICLCRNGGEKNVVAFAIFWAIEKHFALKITSTLEVITNKNSSKDFELCVEIHPMLYWIEWISNTSFTHWKTFLNTYLQFGWKFFYKQAGREQVFPKKSR